ncbi:hypothetical protein ABZU05_06040 [Sneathia vaginalis]|uniref:hypothetical protein n=1 Tax=Sneathia vaginalis TaxID=187101 RepID=UPI0035C726C0
MKKTLLLTSLVASMVAMAGTTGSVKSYAESEAKFETKKSVSDDQKEVKTNTTKSYKVGKIGVETEVKVKGSGLSFGGTFEAKDLELGGVKKVNYLNHSSVWAKYELPELKGVNSYVKATVSPKFANEEKGKEDEYKFDGSAELEGQVSYKYDVLTFGLNSKTNFPFVKSTTNTDNYGKEVKSTHKLFVESEEKKDVFVKGLKDVKANVEIKHDYAKTVAKAGDRVDYVSGEASAKYDAVKDLELEGKVAFKKNISGKEIGDYEILGTKLFVKANARYIHSYELKGTYTGVKHLSLSAKPFAVHVNVSKEVTADNKLKRNDSVLYGVELGAEYKMLNDKLTLTGKSLLAGIHIKNINETASEDSQKLVKENLGVFVFDANAKYDYSVTDKFTVSPEANANLELNVAKEGDKLATKPTLTLTPKVSAKYVPVEGLTIEGEVSVPVKFGVVTKSFEKNSTDNTKYDSTKAVNGFGYDSTSIKTSLNLKYEWK